LIMEGAWKHWALFLSGCWGTITKVLGFQAGLNFVLKHFKEYTASRQVIFVSFVFLCGSVVWTHMPARQAFYHLGHSTSPGVVNCFVQTML
jgi:hypothetical protein